MNMPLRSEVDEIHRNVYELRKEIKSLKKRLAAAEEVVVVESETKKTSPTKSSKKSQST
jgi:predicted P-loop ATPase/GTPase